MDDKKATRSPQLETWKRYARWGRELITTIDEIEDSSSPNADLDARLRGLAGQLAGPCSFPIPPVGSYLSNDPHRLVWTRRLGELAVWMFDEPANDRAVAPRRLVDPDSGDLWVVARRVGGA